MPTNSINETISAHDEGEDLPRNLALTSPVAPEQVVADDIVDRCDSFTPEEIYAEGRRDQWNDDKALIEVATATRKSAARWDMLPAFLEKHQIDYVALVRDIDAEISLAASPEAAPAAMEGMGPTMQLNATQLRSALELAAPVQAVAAYLLTRPSGFSWVLMPFDITPYTRTIFEAEGTTITPLYAAPTQAGAGDAKGGA